ncbi:SpvB/TcaC N-terminal domain-containing protein [Anaeromyxobacter oryzisoli]|uniref:SpvB/TcaC N-terminal domain-containing protein n=1 Tax=Anaeromyxobacter oryzisoli TaxID=2925408 RepID=UPI002413B471|nr:SpvB/TcaC N-terminal domain-containing protein [Anaeromyxobacter sp. SG63]
MSRTWTILAVVSLLAACGERTQAPSVDPRTIRLAAAVVTTEQRAPLNALTDRDTTTTVAIPAPSVLVATFDHEVEVREIRVAGAADVQLSVANMATLVGTSGWSGGVVEPPLRGREFRITVTATGASPRIGELELWGGGRPLAPRDVQALAEATRSGGMTFENVVVARADPATSVLQPAGTQQGDACMRSLLARPAAHVARRAYLVYEANVQRAVVLSRSVAGAAPSGGFWITATDHRRTVVDELDPEQLQKTAEVLLCLPSDATGPVTVNDLRLVEVLDDGTDPFDREAHARFAAELDGDDGTSATLMASSHELIFDRPTALHHAELRVTSAAGQAAVATRDSGTWSDAGAVQLAPPAASLPLDGRTADAVRLTLASSARADLPATSVSELVAAGSGVGPRVASPRLVITYPPPAFRDTTRVGERFGDRAFVQGWAESPAGPGTVEIGGASVAVAGAFSTPLSRPASDTGTWLVTVTARFPDGSELVRTLELSDDREAEVATGEVGSAVALSDDARFGRENQTGAGEVDGRGGKVTLGTEVSLEVPEGALSAKTALSITRKGPEVVPPLDPGMVNVTAPPQAGYRFLPRGQRFAKPVKVGLPYDPALLPEGVPPDDVRTYYYDEAAEEWRALPRVELQPARNRVVSETTHFTFMINAVLVLPDHPGPASFNPNSLKDLKAADPSAGLDLIEAPEANNMGTAQLALPVRLPRARGAYQPELRFAYDSSAGNGWLGVGWDLTVPSVQIDTRFGVPFYDGDERYLADGEQLVPSAGVTSEACEDGTTATRFRARIEKSFRRIRRCGSTPESYWWEITDKSGTVFVYGRHAGARLQSYRDDRIGQWMLEQVIDTHGNLTEYAYEHDQRDVGDASQGEDFRQVYLRSIRYPGKAVRDPGTAFGQVSEHGAYVVDLHGESTQTGSSVRPDVSSSARLGFKVVTRRRLGSVLVRLEPDCSSSADSCPPAETIREYRLGYETGSFGKSRVKKIAVYGAGPDGARPLFHEHAFRWTDADLSAPFDEPQAWKFPQGGDTLPMTRSEERGWGYHFYAGVGPAPDKIGGSGGYRRGGTQAEGETRSSLVDVNGDGLPDRLVTLGSCPDGRCVRVEFNQGAAGTLRPILPPGDPGADGPMSTLPLSRLGHERSASTNNAGQAGYGTAWVNAGFSSSWSESDVFLADADGDGRVDLVTGSGVLLNQPRSAGDAEFQFLPQAGLQEIATDPAAGDPDAAGVNDAITRTPSSPVLEWLAPYEGTVDVSGALAFAHDLQRPVDPAWDGVRLTLFRVSVDLAHSTYLTEQLLTVEKKLGDKAASPVSLQAVHVSPGSRLVFLLSTLSDVPVDTTGPTPLEAVSFAPVITYRGHDPSLVDPTGGKVWVFDASRDFRLAGQPMTALTVPVKGTLQIHSTLTKKLSTDWLHVCIQKFPAGAETGDRRCGETPAGVELLFDETYAPDKTFAGEAIEGSWSVASGDRLVFRVDSDLPVDPAATDWSIRGEMTSVCDGVGGTCRAPTADDAAYTRFSVDPYVPLHLPARGWPVGGDKLSPSPDPHAPEPWVAPAAGVYTISTRQEILEGGSTPRPVFISARTDTGVVFKQRLDEAPATITVTLAAGARLWFEAHSEVEFGETWRPTISGAVPPLRRTWDAVARASESVPLFSIFAGGYHGWRYGVWRSNDPFDAARLIIDPDDYASGDAAQNAETADRLAEGGEAAERLQLAAPLLPRRGGTRWTPDSPGLSPDVPGYVTRDGNTFITASGMHAALEGGLVQPGDGSVVAGQAFRIGKSVRKSGGSSRSFSAGVSYSIGSLNVSIGTGTTHQKSDVLDLNGDRVIDVVSGDGGSVDVRITGIHDLASRPPEHRAVALRTNKDVTLSAGLGVSNPWTKISPEDGIVRAVAGMLPGMGVGGGVNLSSTEEELVDINGDGLPDAVRRDGSCNGKPGFSVRLNLGTAFGAPDCYPAEDWSRPNLDDVSDAIRGAPGVSASMVSPNRVRRTTAITLQSNLGFAFAENWAGGANWESSISATAVSLVDVNGDGLPDWVRRSPSDPKFYVMLNTGAGFLSERAWAMPAWPAAATKPWISGHGLFGGAGDALLRKVASSEFIDAVEVNGTYSAQPNVNAAFSYGIMIGPLTPWLHFSVGGDVTLRRVSGYQLGMMDMDGDGLVDHVLKAEERDQGSNQDVWVRRNQLGGANLLVHVDRPLGGAIDLHYARTGNTVEMPESRWVLDWTVVRDGRSGAAGGAIADGGHDLRIDVVYGVGRYDRTEREFLGFDSVTTTNPRYDRMQPDAVGAPLRKVVRTYRNEAIAFKGLLASERLLDGDGKLFVETVNIYADPYLEAGYRLQDGEPGCDARRPFMFTNDQGWCGVLFPALTRTEKRFHEGQPTAGVTTEQRFLYDTYGNVKEFTDLGDANPANIADDVTASVVYWADDTAAKRYYSVARPFRVEVKDARGGLLQKREGYFDERGSLKRILSLMEQGRTVESNLEWNDDGLLQKYLAPVVDSVRQTYTYGYDPVVRTYVERIEDAHHYVSTARHDYRFGEVRETVDLNGNVTSRELDAFGRIRRIFGPYDTTVPTVDIEYALSPRFPYARTRNRGPDGRSIDTVILVDGLKRVVQTKKTAEVATSSDGASTSVGWSVTGRQAFDGLLRVVEQGQNVFEYGSSPLFNDVPMVNSTTYVLDAMDRKTRTDEPVEPSTGATHAVTDVVYGFGGLDGAIRFRAEVTDPERKVKVMYRDPAERVVAVEERNKGAPYLTRYAYDPLGQLTIVTDAAGHATRLGYDLLGNRTSIDNPDTGLVSFTFDDASKLWQKRTPNLRARNEAITYRYDLDQLVTVDFPEAPDVTYVYGPPGAPGNGAGRIVNVLDDAGSEQREYGKLGETIRTTRVVKPLRPGDFDKRFETRFRFDSFGRMQEIQYPDRETVTYQYDAGGLVKSATGVRPATAHYPAGQETYLRLLTYDVFGQRRRVELGNGAVSTYTYYPESRRLASLRTEVPGQQLQALSYRYDRVGNVLGMTNALPPPTSQRSGPVNFAFGYDDLYRLTSATGRAETRPGISDTFEATYDYDPIHNMTSNTQVHAIRSVLDTGVDVAFPPKTNHAFGYEYGGKGPHQATKIGDQLLVYDGNGNTVRECRDHGDPTCTSTSDHLRRYYWSDDDRLDAVIDGGGLHVTRFVYDAAGERVAKLGRGGESLTIGQWFSLKGRKAGTKHIFVGETRLASKLLPPPGWSEPESPTTSTAAVVTAAVATNVSGCDPSDYQPQKCPVYPGPDPVLQHRIDTTKVRPATYYYHPDHLGSTSWVTDQNGRVHEHVEYFPFGEVWRDRRSESDGAPVKGQQFLFTGKELDEETGLYYFGARYYEPVRARWLTADPIVALPFGSVDQRNGQVYGYQVGRLGPANTYGDDPSDPASLSRYAYVRNDPYKYIDPDGRAIALPGWVAKVIALSQAIEAEAVVVLRSAMLGGAVGLLVVPAPTASWDDAPYWTYSTSDKGRFVGQPDGTLVDTHSTPPGSYNQPGGGRTDILQKEDHGAGQSHTHDPKIHVNRAGKRFVNGREQPGRPVSAEDVKNIESGKAPRSEPKGR